MTQNSNDDIQCELQRLRDELDRFRECVDEMKRAPSQNDLTPRDREILKKKLLEAVTESRVINADATVRELTELAIEVSPFGDGNAFVIDNYLWVAKPCRW